MIRVFIGYDHDESVAYHTCASSIIRWSSRPVSITPIASHHFREFYSRERDAKQSNDFSFTRFLTPYLCDYQGWAIFMDCDIVVNCDIAELWDLRDPEYAVQVCKHEYHPRNATKYLGRVQYPYPCKNWSSVMLMNTEKCTALTPAYVQQASGMELHRFQWAYPEKVGSLPLEYNWLVGEYPHNPDARIIHYTVGGPWFSQYRNTDYAGIWGDENYHMAYAKPDV